MADNSGSTAEQSTPGEDNPNHAIRWSLLTAARIVAVIALFSIPWSGSDDDESESAAGY